MDIHITARHCEIPDRIRRYVDEHVAKLEKYHPKLHEAHVVFVQEKFRHEVEIVILGKALRVTAKARTSDDQLGAFTRAYAKIRRQLTDHYRRHHQRRTREAKLASAKRKNAKS